MKKSFTHIIVLLGFIVIAGALMLIHILSERIPANPAGTVGNTAGNINNGGLFCELDGMVYFSNPMDQGALYSMTVDEKDLTKLYNGNICNILAAGNHLYYFMKNPTDTTSLGNLRVSHAFYRSTLKGKKVTSMTADVVITAQLVNDYLYLLTSTDDGPGFYKLKTDRSDKVVLADYTVNPACAKDGVIYYNGTGNNHYLYALNTETDIQSELWKGNIWYPVLDGNYFYYLDVENNYRLCRYDYSQNVIEVLTNDRVECYNVGNGYIYYQCNSQATPALKRMRLDGSDVVTIAQGNYTAIHMTSKYVYFRSFSEDGILYHSLIGSDTYSSM